MASSTILIFGATGPAGICLLRESLFRKHATVAYVRNASKLPDDLTKNPLLEVVEGQMDDAEKLSLVVSRAAVIISLLGPSGRTTGEYPYPGYYSTIIPLVRQHSVKRILVLATVSVEDSDDKSSFVRRALVTGVKYGFAAAYRTNVAIANVFRETAEGVNWIVFRVGMVHGEHDKESWRNDRQGAVFAGSVGEPGWTWNIKRGALARWLIDRAEVPNETLASRTPAVSNLKA
ncbi:hypothetical protein VD0002_g8553 [Verticillium dahliae]|uniref:NAD(P)-binding domain-containing protein n=1 Tax=Verticillium dahliae TaxID=27337 RepID=A0AA44WAS1_VERDA|nr:hypothetical protein BJF96_g8609 [Verticillium dahliae]PNH45192.1 hypothetical protein VD0003_g9271 [Verticillium dahliae]PNH58985.1 hypothetical protein VD0002_g8553 [Verticillium dahliae]